MDNELTTPDVTEIIEDHGEEVPAIAPVRMKHFGRGHRDVSKMRKMGRPKKTPKTYQPEQISTENVPFDTQPMPTEEGTHPEPVETDGDLIDIWERRLLDPGRAAAPIVRIKRPGMHLRWINLTARGRYQRARYDQGYVPVTKDLLSDEREIYGVSYTTEGYVCRGEKQGEMLMMIPEAIYKKIQQRRSELNKKSYGKLKDNLRQAGATHFGNKYGGSAGDQAADAAGGFKGSIAFGTERVTADGSTIGETERIE
jgi:hypothetical protein